MKYYLIFINNTTVVSISSYDTQEARDIAFDYWKTYTYANGVNYNSLQILNEVN